MLLHVGSDKSPWKLWVGQRLGGTRMLILTSKGHINILGNVKNWGVVNINYKIYSLTSICTCTGLFWQWLGSCISSAVASLSPAPSSTTSASSVFEMKAPSRKQQQKMAKATKNTIMKIHHHSKEPPPTPPPPPPPPPPRPRPLVWTQVIKTQASRRRASTGRMFIRLSVTLHLLYSTPHEGSGRLISLDTAIKFEVYSYQ